METKRVLTEEERKQHKREAQKRYTDKIRALKQSQAENEAANYKAMYEDLSKAFEQVSTKNIELEKLCKVYAEKAQQATEALQKAAIEYNARIQHMLDCVKHAYVSMQFAVTADKTQGGK